MSGRTPRRRDSEKRTRDANAVRLYHPVRDHRGRSDSLSDLPIAVAGGSHREGSGRVKHFYKSALRRCACGKPATCEVLGPRNERYDTCCERCGDRRVRELMAYWNRPEAAAPTEKGPEKGATNDD